MKTTSHSLLRNGILAVFFVMLLVGIPQTSHASAIKDDLKSTIDQVIQIVTKPDYKKDRTKNRAQVRALIDPKFDYEEMGRRSLAKDWKNLSPQDRQAFIDLFGKLLENSYASKIESYRDEKIEYSDEIIKGRFAMVKTKIVRTDDTIGVDYKLINKGNAWRVYDFIIEGVSMIRNYRSQFSKIIRKDSFSKLMEKMNKKVGELEKGANDDKI